MLDEAARLFAERGFHGATIDQLASLAGVRGPAIYKHFSSKASVLSALLCDVSADLLAGGREVADGAGDPGQALEGLVAFHAEFALAQPEVIRVQDRDLASLPAAERRRVRFLQREYVELWVEVLVAVRPDLERAEARMRVHAVFGLLNSTPYSVRPRGERRRSRRTLTAMALAGLRA